ncbi:MAG: FHA domain-containing protein [Lentisphaerae bacterium]|nr:FHA domain-containing protein [Lentisphaerota bacterium]
MAELAITSGREAGRTIGFQDDAITIGRAPDNVLVLDDPAVSGHHCTVVRDGGKVTLRDLDSTNGTVLNGNPVKEARLKPGDTVGIGDVTLVVKGDDIDIEPPSPDAEAPTPAPSAPKPAPAPKPSAAGAMPPTVQGPSPFGAKKDTKWIWVSALVLVGLLVIAALAFFFFRLYES